MHFWMLEFWWVLLLLVMLTPILLVISRRQYDKMTVSERIKRLHEEEQELSTNLKALQRKRFTSKKMSENQYTREHNRIIKRIASIKKERSELRGRRHKLITMEKALHTLDRERKEIVHDIEKLQNQYYTNKSIGKSAYEEQNTMLQERLAEIEDEHLTLELLQ